MRYVSQEQWKALYSQQSRLSQSENWSQSEIPTAEPQPSSQGSCLVSPAASFSTLNNESQRIGNATTMRELNQLKVELSDLHHFARVTRTNPQQQELCVVCEMEPTSITKKEWQLILTHPVLSFSVVRTRPSTTIKMKGTEVPNPRRSSACDCILVC